MWSSYKGNLRVTIFGGSHEAFIGVVINGLPPGEKINFSELERLMSRRAPGNSSFATKRKEPDIPQFLSGMDGNTTNGKPLCAVIQNTNQRSADYKNLQRIPRPNHADFAAYIKYGKEINLSGGGHFSGRMTAPLLIAGGIAMQILKHRNIDVFSHVYSIGDIFDSSFYDVSDSSSISHLKEENFGTIDPEKKYEMISLIEMMKNELDSIGGTSEVMVTGLPTGLGRHMFLGIENIVSQIVFAVPGVKGVSFGKGFEFSNMKGSEANDEYRVQNGVIRTRTNNCGGIVGGMTTGEPFIMSTVFKPTPSISRPQRSVNMDSMQKEILSIKGRHDPCIVPRGTVALEGAVALAFLDIMIGENAL